MVSWPHEDPLDHVRVFLDIKCIDDMRAYSAIEFDVKLDGKETGNHKGSFSVLCSPDSRNAALDYDIRVDYSLKLNLCNKNKCKLKCKLREQR